MAQFDCFDAEAVGFLQELKANNTKDWFAANKATYDTHIKAPSKLFAEDMELALRDLTGQDHSGKIFRIHRDVRFSKDNTPYNAHLHLAFLPTGQAVQPPMWFFGLSPEKLSLGCGVFQYDKWALDTFREAMAGPLGAELTQITLEMRKRGFRISDPELKRIPPGFDKDHPHEEVLRRKGFAVWMDTETPAFVLKSNLTELTAAEFAKLMPVFQLLSRIT
ncbi:DUF2461 domain-containing protein [Ruegeria conchae]|uniref:Uncharacterized protein (TIGR02453 family) n=1 Tax=Ruegeria conchae TaxID=981384 RepID=A0A497YWK0_9RHOB|nr:DUF2461 domain-containing protein [Ruegeria conchae]RLJ98463.1 uncharacterized protein (TIGR02453 family) [Ruegeria conchae]